MMAVLLFLISFLFNSVFSIGIVGISDDVSWRRVMESEMRQLKNRVRRLELQNVIINTDCCKPQPDTITASSEDVIKHSN